MIFVYLFFYFSYCNQRVFFHWKFLSRLYFRMINVNGFGARDAFSRNLQKNVTI